MALNSDVPLRNYSHSPVEVWGPLTQVREGNSKICPLQNSKFYHLTKCDTPNLFTFDTFFCDLIWNMPLLLKCVNFFISTIVSPPQG